MTLRLILTRHAKSDWTDTGLDDHDRPLNRRGRRSAQAMGAWLAAQAILPGQVLCSTALRARQTWGGIASALPSAPQPAYRRDLYHAGAQDMLAVLKGAADAKTVMIVGHNPGSGTMAAMLASTRPPDPDIGRYPTCYTAVFAFSVADWANVDWGLGQVVATMSPRRLETTESSRISDPGSG